MTERPRHRVHDSLVRWAEQQGGCWRGTTQNKSLINLYKHMHQRRRRPEVESVFSFSLQPGGWRGAALPRLSTEPRAALTVAHYPNHHSSSCRPQGLCIGWPSCVPAQCQLRSNLPFKAAPYAHHHSHQPPLAGSQRVRLGLFCHPVQGHLHRRGISITPQHPS